MSISMTEYNEYKRYEGEIEKARALLVTFTPAELSTIHLIFKNTTLPELLVAFTSSQSDIPTGPIDAAFSMIGVTEFGEQLDSLVRWALDHKKTIAMVIAIILASVTIRSAYAKGGIEAALNEFMETLDRLVKLSSTVAPGGIELTNANLTSALAALGISGPTVSVVIAGLLGEGSDLVKPSSVGKLSPVIDVTATSTAPVVMTTRSGMSVTE